MLSSRELIDYSLVVFLIVKMDLTSPSENRKIRIEKKIKEYC